MFEFLKLGLMKKGVLTKEYPREECAVHTAFMGLPIIDATKCDRCSRCIAACPTSAISLVPDGVEVSTARCIFCAACADACPNCIRMGHEFELAAKNKEHLKVVYKHG
jgi:formate hydrogenlyase subunit 6/NADH:ubiquinone oxidoreductase subunit I